MNLSTDPVDNPGENRRASTDTPTPTPFHGTLSDLRPIETEFDDWKAFSWREDWPDLVLMIVVLAAFWSVVWVIWRWVWV